MNKRFLNSVSLLLSQGDQPYVLMGPVLNKKYDDDYDDDDDDDDDDTILFLLNVYVVEAIPLQVQGVNVTRGTSIGYPTLTVQWTAVSGTGITYTVRYSKINGTTTEPPSGASTMSGITGTSTTLSGLKQGTSYYIWVAAVSSGGQGPYSIRVSQITYNG